MRFAEALSWVLRWKMLQLAVTEKLFCYLLAPNPPSPTPPPHTHTYRVHLFHPLPSKDVWNPGIAMTSSMKVTDTLIWNFWIGKGESSSIFLKAYFTRRERLGCLEQSKIPVPPCPLPASLVAHLVHGTESYIKPGQ